MKSNMAEGLARPADLPARIGRHSVIGYLADGGMAEIFLGKEPDGRPVVIKRILPHLARQQNFVAMFIDEARIGSLVHHPNVVEVFELGQVGTDLFLVMEYLAGESTSGVMRRLHIRNEQLPVAVAAHIVAEACAGLQHAHELRDEAGTPLHLVHRDISLSNLFITYAGETKVLDFGIAKAADRLTRTATGQVKGKFSYMSPEQCRGEPLDLRSDIFSLGVVLYELTTQRRLFKRANELMVLKAVTEQAIPRPTREILNYPPELEAICLKALARDREQRFGSMLEMREALVRFTGAADQRAQLAGVMTHIFGERIAEKRQLLTNIRANTNIETMPAAEVDESVEVPQMREHSSTSPARAEPARKRWPLLAGFVIAAAAGVGIYLAVHASSPEPAPIVVTPAPVVEMKPEPATVPAPHGFTLHVDSIPPGAKLTIGAARGTTPFDLHFDQSATVAIDLALDGYLDVHQQLAVDKDQALLIPLVAAPKKLKSVIGKKKKPAEPDPFKRFD